MWYEAMEKSLKRDKGEALHALATAYLKFAHKHYARWSALFEHRMPEDKPIPDWYLPKLARFFDLVEHALLPHVADNHAKARMTGKILWASIHGICVLALSGKLALVKAESPERLIAMLVDNTILGLKPGS
jgi:hypothetical protein